MREIKFRGKRMDAGTWVYGYYYSECGNTYIIEDRQKESMTKRNIPFLVDENTVGQYTGLKDKQTNMREVYEHDLYELNGVLCEVVFHYNSQLAAFVFLEVLSQELRSTPIGEMLDMFPAIYKGNIFDNKDLLEEK